MMKKASILSCFICVSSLAANMSQPITGQNSTNEFENSLKKYGEKPKKTDVYAGSEKASSPYIGKKKNKEYKGSSLKSGSSAAVMGAQSVPSNYSEVNNKKIMDRVRNESKSSFSLSYVYDSFDYKDERGIFDQTFKQSNSDSFQAGYLLFNIDNYISKGTFTPYWGIGFGFGYNQGRGVFEDGTESIAKIRLYTIPMDVHIGSDLSLGRYMKLSASAGPSTMVLWQDRDDRDDGEDGKKAIQIGFGYAATAKYSLNLSQIFMNTGFDIYRKSDISNIALNFEVRHQSYDNFQDDITISGTSFGAGFTFEFL